MPSRVKAIDEKLSVCKKIGLSCHAVRSQSTGEIINDSPWCLLPSGDYGREHVITALASGDTMEAIADTMRAPNTHNTSSQSPLAILRIKLGAFGPSFLADIRCGIILQPRIIWTVADLGLAVARSTLDRSSRQRWPSMIRKRTLNHGISFLCARGSIGRELCTINFLRTVVPRS